MLGQPLFLRASLLKASVYSDCASFSPDASPDTGTPGRDSSGFDADPSSLDIEATPGCRMGFTRTFQKSSSSGSSPFPVHSSQKGDGHDRREKKTGAHGMKHGAQPKVIRQVTGDDCGSGTDPESDEEVNPIPQTVPMPREIDG